jgi:hypothetical protein
MRNYVVASGEQIYQSAIEGAKRKFNRSTDNYEVYEAMLHEYYEMMLDDPSNQAACARIRKRTKNSWRNANISLSLVMLHKHRAFEPCETHARVCLMGMVHKVFDIPLEFWNFFETQNIQTA